ncbi:pyridoxal kinase [Escherichia coli]
MTPRFLYREHDEKNILAIQSHVVYGHAGNSAAEFPMRRPGANVWPLNTVQFSNHTQYGKWTGCVMPPSHLTEIVQGIAAIDKLHTCDAVLSGYLGSAEQGEHILGIVRQGESRESAGEIFLRSGNGSSGKKGCIVAPGVAEFHVRHGLPASDIIAPNLVELEILCEHAVNNVEEAVLAARELIAQGPQIVLVKHRRELATAVTVLKCCWSPPMKPGISAVRWWILVCASR